MSREKSTGSRWKLKPFSEYLKEEMSPETWAWYSKFRRRVLEPELLESNDE